MASFKISPLSLDNYPGVLRPETMAPGYSLVFGNGFHTGFSFITDAVRIFNKSAIEIGLVRMRYLQKTCLA
jgi:hypothetical protein